jgi:DNA-binding winged helix-turn-helix (wHTH) protein
MQRTDDAGRAAPLVLELASGTARLHGEELELPLREFKLLAALAARVGDPVAPELLIKAVWPDAPWTSTNDLYTLVSKLRRLIDGPDKFGNNIRNRRGFGYLLDLKPDELVVIDPAPVDPTPLTVDLTEKTEVVVSAQPVVEEPPAVEETQSAPVLIALGSAPRTAMVLALVVTLLAGFWGAGYVLSRRNSDRPVPREDSEVSQPETPETTEAKKPRQVERKKDRDKHQRKGRTRNSGPAVEVAAPGSTDTPATTVPATSGSTSGSRKGSEKKEPAPPPLPPAPTRYLYHLVNEKTGDHFVTTDGNTASEYEAKGYEGGAIGRTYSYQEDGTRAITTDAGTAYVFIAAAPKTEPASRTLGLWYSSNNNGDFFYTTSESAAKQSGWSGSLIGYVRSL